MKRREFLSKIGAVLATAATAPTLAKAGDVKNWRKPAKRSGVVYVNNDAVGAVWDLKFDFAVRKLTYKVRFKDGRTEYRTAYEKHGKFEIDPFDHRRK